MDFKKIVLNMSNMCEWDTKVTKSSIFQEKPQPGMLLPGHPCRVNLYEKNFWTDADLFDLGQQADLTAVQQVFNPFSQFIPQIELYSQF